MATSILLDYPSSSSSSMSSLNTPALSATSLPRRIRFAPLPDPRRPEDIQQLDLDDKLDSNNTTYSFDDSSSSSSPPSDSDRPPSPLYCPPTPASKPTTQQMLAHHSISPSLHWSKPKSLSLLPFPFKKLSPSSSSSGSSHSLTPTPSLDSNPTPTDSRVVSAESVLTLGPFRTSSKANEPTSSSTHWGFGLTRWHSPTVPKNGSPLARSQSVPTKPTAPHSTSKKSNTFTVPSQTTKPRSGSTSSTSSTGSIKPHPRKGLRMLNGRVYGGPKHRHPGVGANPFANARDDDVEFVEWGYGGMGSVRGAQSAGVVGRADDRERTKWERLQHNGRNVVVGHSAGKSAEGNVDEEDDGSGMGWVKKRKAARERKEKEDKEQAEADSAHTSLPQVELTTSEDPTPPHVRQPSSSSVATPRPSSPIEEEHTYTAVTLPAHLHRHHRRVQQRTASIDTAPSVSIVPNSEEAPAGVETDSETESEDDGTRPAEDDYGDDEDEDEDEDDGEERRKTALGAGVEKISRHN